MLITKDNHGRIIGWRETYFSKGEADRRHRERCARMSQNISHPCKQ
jgi:hypothetical protein